MPCETVTVSGPSVTGEVEVTSFNVETGVNEIIVSYNVTNNSNVTQTVSFEVTLDGSRVDSTQFQNISPGRTLQDEVMVNTDVPQNEEMDFRVCVQKV